MKENSKTSRLLSAFWTERELSASQRDAYSDPLPSRIEAFRVIHAIVPDNRDSSISRWHARVIRSQLWEQASRNLESESAWA